MSYKTNSMGETCMSKTLYHYTTTYHLPSIFADGYLKLTESNLRPDQASQPVVWLTTMAEPDANGLGLSGSIKDKTEVRIHVEKDGRDKAFEFWKKFSRKHKINKAWAKRLESCGTSNTWWVSTEVIRFDKILLIENRNTGTVYYERGRKRRLV